jgi:hypothetical protein
MRFRALVALALIALPAHAETTASPLTRGEVRFRDHDNGVQHPTYTAHRRQTCAPAQAGDLRQRLVDLAAQEWARFGYPISQRIDARVLRQIFPELRRAKQPPYLERDPLMLQAIGGYWAALTGVASGEIADSGGFEIANANAMWIEEAAQYRANSGWATPWSAAFMSWLMCEAGVENFRRSWAHRDYVDAAIAASDGGASHPYRAHEPTQAPAIGDLLCSTRAYYRADLATRRNEPDGEAQMHCDLVVAIDSATGLILAIGGNVENAVSLVPYRLLRIGNTTRVRSVCRDEKICGDERLLAVLSLDAPASAAALINAPALYQRPERPPPRMR